MFTCLQASQSGLESAKQTLQEHAKQKKRDRSNQALPASDGKPLAASAIWSALVARTSSSFLNDDDDTPWLRTAAQAAMALQFHGILETTGHESSSAKIQHASLPKFGNHSTNDSWDEDEKHINPTRFKGGNDSQNGTCFEAGVINIESELGGIGGYDLLPPPGPSETHHVLNAGCELLSMVSPSSRKTVQPTSSRFVYNTAVVIDGSISKIVDDTADAALGPIKVDDDIEKIRDIVCSVDNTMGKLYRASATIRSAQHERNSILLELLRDVDSWGDIHGEAINQCDLVNGVAELEKHNSSIETSNKNLCRGKFFCVVASTKNHSNIFTHIIVSLYLFVQISHGSHHWQHQLL